MDGCSLLQIHILQVFFPIPTMIRMITKTFFPHSSDFSHSNDHCESQNCPDEMANFNNYMKFSIANMQIAT